MLDTKIKQLAGENNDQELQDHDKYQDLMEKANSGAAEEGEYFFYFFFIFFLLNHHSGINLIFQTKYIII